VREVQEAEIHQGDPSRLFFALGFTAEYQVLHTGERCVTFVSICQWHSPPSELLNATLGPHHLSHTRAQIYAVSAQPPHCC
jgi:hypothetical protein